jgi:hypothetical protein
MEAKADQDNGPFGPYSLLPDAPGGGNPFAACRKYLAQGIMPDFSPACPELQEQLRKVPNYELFRTNSGLHNGGAGNPANDLLCRQLSFSGLVKPLKPGSERTCVLTLVATSLDSGVLALPYAFSKVGLVLGIAVLSLSACFSCLSLIVLMVASRYTEVTSLASLLALATGKSSAGLLIDGCLMVYGVASILALLIFEGDFIPAILQVISGTHVPGRTACILATALLVWPMVLPSKVSALRYIAAFSPFAILFMAGNVVVQAPVCFEERSLGSEVVLWELEWRNLSALCATRMLYLWRRCLTDHQRRASLRWQHMSVLAAGHFISPLVWVVISVFRQWCRVTFC